MYFLDSDICIHLLRGNLPQTYELLRKSDPSLFGIPSIVEGELRLGAIKSDHPSQSLLLVERFLAPFASIPFDRTCAIMYSKIRAELERKGSIIGPNDMLIAATAMAHGAVLVTGNIREFSRIPELSVENWVEIDL